MAELQELLQYLTEMRGSDLYVKAGAPPHVRVDGRLQTAPFAPVDVGQTRLLAEEVVPAVIANLGDVGCITDTSVMCGA